MMARPRMAMSRAVVFCDRLGRPEALRNVVARMPSWRALTVIAAANFPSLPLNPSAITTAASFADLMAMALIRSITRMVSPAFSPSLEGACLEACLETVKRVFRSILPRSSASKVMYSVMILVSDAG